MKTSLKSFKGSKEEAYLIIREYLANKLELSNRKEISETSFDNPNWAYYQAYQAGIKKALNDVLDFIPDQGK